MSMGSSASRDHPRVCGEHFSDTARFVIPLGSSPRMRGTLLALFCLRFFVWDHPRVCGEHILRLVPDRHATGSSPRMRGTLGTPDTWKQPLGIIPAYAGNTRFCHNLSKRFRDHPRVCGEHWLNSRHMLKGKGSSPRMRGTPRTVSNMRQRSGIIPAYAGNTV